MLQVIRWHPRRRILSVSAEHRRSETCRSAVERVTERAYGIVELGQWLLDAGFVIRGVHDAATLGPPGRCSARAIFLCTRMRGKY
jgi:hypothetical protein